MDDRPSMADRTQAYPAPRSWVDTPQGDYTHGNYSDSVDHLLSSLQALQDRSDTYYDLDIEHDFFVMPPLHYFDDINYLTSVSAYFHKHH